MGNWFSQTTEAENPEPVIVRSRQSIRTNHAARIRSESSPKIDQSSTESYHDVSRLYRNTDKTAKTRGTSTRSSRMTPSRTQAAEHERKKEEFSICVGCSTILKSDHIGIKCLQSHAICTGCSQTYVDMCLSQPDEKLPPKCPVCRVDVILTTFEMQLNTEKSAFFNNYMLCNVIFDKENNPNEMIVHCPFCKYFEIRHKKGINFVFCQNLTCKKLSCFYCHLECKLPERNDISVVKLDNENENQEAEKHFECAHFYELKSQIENAIEEGLKVKCPKCGTGGRKDDACTHMACAKCNQIFCYVCGFGVELCDKEQGSDSIYAHNVDWPTNEKRCPMYFYELADVDRRWPETDTECLNFFHDIRIKKKLRQIFSKSDMGEIRRLENKYKCIRNNGFDIERILNDDLDLIKRT